MAGRPRRPTDWPKASIPRLKKRKIVIFFITHLQCRSSKRPESLKRLMWLSLVLFLLKTEIV